MLAPAEVVGRQRHEIHDLAYDARAARPGSLFFCVPGERADGHDFAPEAVAERCGRARRPAARSTCRCRSSSSPTRARRWRSPRTSSSAGPTEELAVAGVTGTAGKTTTAFLLYAVLAAAGRRPGLLGTIETRVDGERRAGDPDDRRGDRPPAALPRDARRGRSAAARWRRPRTARRSADSTASASPCSSSPTSTGTTSTSTATWRTTSTRSGGCSSATTHRPPRSTSATSTAAGWPTSCARSGTPLLTYGLTRRRRDPPGNTVEVDTRAAGALQPRERARRRRGGPPARDRRRGDRARRRLGRRRPGPLPVRGRGPGLRRDRRLRAQARRARERPAHRARAHGRAARSACSAAAATATGASGR